MGNIIYLRYLLILVLQLLMLQPAVQRQESDPPSLKSLISDPYIIIAAGTTIYKILFSLFQLSFINSHCSVIS